MAESTRAASDRPAITCASCDACCCRLEVMLMSGDDIRGKFTQQDKHGVWVMARLDDGWCAALDRSTRRCTIYAHRPMVCRDYEVGAMDCLEERAHLDNSTGTTGVTP